ncbi:MAG TPA: restriction endonuclease subunit R [Crinalium sp.]|jgi:hypothetical protein
MVQTIQAKAVTLQDLITNFGIQLVRHDQFFREWQDDLPDITDLEKQLLDQVVDGFINLLNYPPLLEDVVRMSVIDPILFLGGFYLPPFHVKSEPSIAISTDDEGLTIAGSLDVLVLKDHLWILVIESKRAAFSVEAGLAQILAYMLASPESDKPCFGMITTGGSFMFIKLVKGNSPQYATSNLFGIRNPGDLYTVFSILKRLGQIKYGEE